MMMAHEPQPASDRTVVVSHGGWPTSSRWIEAVADYVVPRGIELRRAASRNETLDWVERGGTDLVILSHDVPRMDGLSVLRSIRVVNAEVPCLLVASEAPQRMLAEALALQAFSVVRQPVEPELLTGLLARILGTQ